MSDRGLEAVTAQGASSLRLDWGPSGAHAITADCDVVVVVDVLSFTTTVTVAVDRGTAVHPYRWRDDSAAAFAAEQGAALAVGRSQAAAGQVSLSPHSVRVAVNLDRLVMPSPNGATITTELAASAPTVLAMSLRNRNAVASWLLQRRRSKPGVNVALVAAGERWPDGTLRPAVEDLWGAGALVAALRTGGWTSIAVEAEAAAAAFAAVGHDVAAALRACVSGRELITAGYADDVHVAAELDGSKSVPVLRNGAFVAATHDQ